MKEGRIVKKAKVPDDDEGKALSVIRKGTEFTGKATGAAVGGAMGTVLGGPWGAAAGAVVGTALESSFISVLSDIADRYLSNREEMRIGKTAWVALKEIRRRLDEGQVPRKDWSQQNEERGWSDAEEIFEGVLLKAKNEHEEKKAKILGILFANTAFDESITLGEANHLVKTLEGLSYRQLCIMSYFGTPQKLRPTQKIRPRTVLLQHDLINLNQRGILGRKTASVSPSHPNAFSSSFTWSTTNLKVIGLSARGKEYYRMYDLDGLDYEDVDTLIEDLTEGTIPFTAEGMHP